MTETNQCKLSTNTLSPISREYKRVMDHLFRRHASELAPIHPNLSSVSKRFLHKVVDMMRHADRTWSSAILEETRTKIDATYMNAIQEKPWYQWIAKPIQHMLEIQPKHGWIYKLLIHGRTVDIHFVVPQSTMRLHPESFSEKHREKYMRMAIRRVIVWLHVAYAFTHETCKHDSTIYLFLSDSKKQFMTYKDTLHPIHTNSGASNVCYPTGQIVIYRYEEWFKVLIHETFHYLGMEFSQIYDEQQAQVTALIQEAFPRCHPSAQFLVFETYCETWAEILNVLFLSFFSQKPPKGMVATRARRGASPPNQTRRNTFFDDLYVCNNVVSQTEVYLQYEQWFSLVQCAKMLKHFELTYEELFTRDPRVTYNHMGRYDLFSYHILKSIWMYRVNDFIVWCVANNRYGEEKAVSLDFHKTAHCVEDYVKQIIRYSRDDVLREGYLQADKWILGDNEVVSPIQKTLRMTMFE